MREGEQEEVRDTEGKRSTIIDLFILSNIPKKWIKGNNDGILENIWTIK